MARYALLTSCFAILSLVTADGIYTGKSPVLQVNAKNYDSLIAQSNHTSIVEFYAPWCGHCQNLKPAYEKAAKSLAGLAKVAAVNCDDDSNKPFCGQFGVQGFPTLKIVRPGKKPGKPTVEDYQGQRTAKGIVEAVTDKISNHVKRLQGNGVDTWLEDTAGAKAILFTDKGTTAAMIKALAIDFLGSINFAQIRSKETDAVDKFGITSFPTIILLPSTEGEPITYDGEMNKEALTEFFSQVAPPNPDPAPKKSKASTGTKKPKASSSASSKFSKASEAHKSSDFEDYMEHASTIILDDDMPTESPLPIVDQEKPMVVPDVAPPIATLAVGSELAAACLTPKSGNCILVLLPQPEEAESTLPEAATQALTTFAEIADKHHKRRANIFPFYAVPSENENAMLVRQALGLKPETELEVIVVNMKRGRWRRYNAEDYGTANVESFVDAIRFGEGKNEKLPADFFVEPTEEEITGKKEDAKPEADIDQDAETAASDPNGSAEPSIHDEL